MSTLDDLKLWTPAEVSEMTGLHSESQLKRLASGKKIPCHRGSRTKVMFSRQDVEAIIRMTEQPAEPAKGRASSIENITPPTVSPFRTTVRSRAAHNERAAS